jgi:hypothetical protein
LIAINAATRRVVLQGACELVEGGPIENPHVVTIGKRDDAVSHQA